MATTDTPWTGSSDRRMYLTSGQFSSTLKTSQDTSTFDVVPTGISFDGTDTPVCGDNTDKLYVISGQFSSIVKTSFAVAPSTPNITGISPDGIDTLWSNDFADKMYLTSGQFSSTIKDSENVSSIDSNINAISTDRIDTLWIGAGDDKLYKQSGKFTSILITSQAVAGIESIPSGIDWDGTNVPWAGWGDKKMYLQSGMFSSTLLTSLDISAVDANIQGVGTNDYVGRLGIVDVTVLPSALTIAIAQENVLLPLLPLTVTIPAPLALGLSQPSASFVIDGSIALPTLSISSELEGVTMITGADVSVSVLPLSLGMAIDEPPPVILGDAILLLPGVPMILLESSLSLHAPEVSITDDVKIIVTNARTFAISEYAAFAFNSMAKFNGKYLYAKADGIYEGGGDKDNGADIIASYKTGSFNINASEVQKLRNAFLNFRSDGDIQLFSVGNEVTTRLYNITNSTPGTIHEQREKFERGIRDNHFSFGISNVAGSSFEIKTAKILTEPIRKRR